MSGHIENQGQDPDNRAENDFRSLLEKGLLFTPPGLEMRALEGDIFVIHYQRTGMGCLNFFLLVWLTGWGIACVSFLRQYLDEGQIVDNRFFSLLWIVFAWVVELFVACSLVYFLFCQKSFQIENKFLIVETNVLGVKRNQIIPKESIERFVQVKDGGQGEDNFPSWGLEVESKKKKTNLIVRQPYEKSHWLGQILAEWAQVDFIEARQ